MIRYSFKKFLDLSLQELYDIMELRQLVFAVEQNCPYLDADGMDQSAYHLMGRNEKGKLMTYARLIPPGLSYANYSAIGRVINHQDIRNKGEGRKLMALSIQLTLQLFPGFPIQISAQEYLHDFYSSLGFIKIGDGYLEDGIPHIHMIYQVK